MCSGKGIGHWITYSTIMSLDSSAASRFASGRCWIGLRHADFRTDYDRGLKTLLKTPVVAQAAAAGHAAVSLIPKDAAATASDCLCKNLRQHWLPSF